MIERIKAGVKLLDSHQPDWRKKVDPKKLDLLHHDNCILGQVYGGFSTGARALGIWGRSIEFGFNSWSFEADELERLWLAEL